MGEAYLRNGLVQTCSILKNKSFKISAYVVVNLIKMPVNSDSQSFQGVIDEIPYISVDYFLCVQSSLALFLSHCHAGMFVLLASLFINSMLY